MKFDIITTEQFATSEWAGGITTQLLISPENATVSLRDFVFRISIAKVDLQESDFTRYEGFNRALMVLEGNILVNHENQYEKQLTPFETDFFPGNWFTKSKGICTDFNVITTALYSPKLYSVNLNQNEKYEIHVESNMKIFAIYALHSTLVIETGIRQIVLEKGTLFTVTDTVLSVGLKITSHDPGRFVVVKVLDPTADTVD